MQPQTSTRLKTNTKGNNMKLIKLTLMNPNHYSSINEAGDIYINPDNIGHCYRVPEKTENYPKTIAEHTVVGVTTHNNGGFKIKQTPEQIIKLITAVEIQK